MPNETPAEHNPAEHNPASNIEIARPLYVLTECKYNFRKDKLGNKRPSVNLKLPFITVDGLVESLSDEKIVNFVLEVVNDSIYQAAKSQISDEEKPVNTQEELDINSLSLQFLANMPPAERRGGGIPKETWEAWGEDYMEIMPTATGKKREHVQNGLTFMLKKFQPVKTDKLVLAKLKELLDIYITSTERLDEFEVCVKFLAEKVDSLLASDSSKLLENL